MNSVFLLFSLPGVWFWNFRFDFFPSLPMIGFSALGLSFSSFSFVSLLGLFLISASASFSIFSRYSFSCSSPNFYGFFCLLLVPPLLSHPSSFIPLQLLLSSGLFAFASSHTRFLRRLVFLYLFEHAGIRGCTLIPEGSRLFLWLRFSCSLLCFVCILSFLPLSFLPLLF